MKIHIRVRCDTNAPFCLRRFTIAVDPKYVGKKIRVECPGCCNKLEVVVRQSPEADDETPFGGVIDLVNEKVEEVLTTLGEIKVSEVLEKLTGRGGER